MPGTPAASGDLLASTAGCDADQHLKQCADAFDDYAERSDS